MSFKIYFGAPLFNEISEITGMCRNSVASRLRRIKIKLQQLSEE